MWVSAEEYQEDPEVYPLTPPTYSDNSSQVNLNSLEMELDTRAVRIIN